MSREAMKLALELKNSASAYWTEKEIPFIEKLIKLLALAAQPAQQESETIVQTFTGLPRRKLRELLAGGWEVNGVCFQRTEEDGTVRRGAATIGGMVIWWNAEQPAQKRPPNCGTGFCSCIECVMEPKQPAPTKCWKCGDADPAFTDVCQVPACGMREKP